MNPILEFFLTRGVGRLLRKSLLIASAWLALHHLPGLTDSTVANLVDLGVGVAGLGLSWAWSRWHEKLVFAKGVVGKESPASSACPKTLQTAQGLSVLVFGLMLLGPSAFAQGTNATAIVQGNPLASAVAAAADRLDTNSTFFVTERFAIRAGAVLRGKVAGAITGADVTFQRDWLACLDVAESTQDNTVDMLQGTVGYRVPLHNIEFDPLLGANYRWDDKAIYGVFGVRVSYSLTDFMFTWTQPVIEFNTQRPVTGITGGVGFKF